MSQPLGHTISWESGIGWVRRLCFLPRPMGPLVPMDCMGPMVPMGPMLYICHHFPVIVAITLPGMQCIEHPDSEIRFWAPAG